jgi:tetratricopeptide (TPR) repeat protein
MSLQLRSACVLFLLSFVLPNNRARAQKSSPDAVLDATQARDLKHQDPMWLTIRDHLPDPATATPEKLEMVGDVLRARRFPEDAVDYYVFALRRGGDEATLMNKLGITELELRNIQAARICFQRAVRVKRKNSEGWNNLGAVEYLDGRFGNAISDYTRAIKLDKKSATFHSNLGTAYFEEKDFRNARRQYEIAMQINPAMAEHDGPAGVTAHMLSPADHAHYCYEMARLYAERRDEANLLHYLTMASEGGFDVLSEMSADKVMTNYRKDPRVLLLVRNAQALRSGREAAAVSKSELQPLPGAEHP